MGKKLSSIFIFVFLSTMLVPFGMMDAYAEECVGPGSSVTIDNGLTPADDGFFQVEVDGAGETDDVSLKPEGSPLDDDIMFETIMYYETDTKIESLSETVTDGPCLLPDGSVESSGEFSGSGGDTISWTANSSIPPGEVRMETEINFDCPGCDENFDGLLRIHSYFDEDVGDDFSNCVLIVRGSAATDDLELFIVDLDDEYGVSQGGGFGDNLIGATFDGWAADQFSDLRNDIENGDVIVSPTGVIDLVDLPAGSSPGLGDFNGPEDITTVMSYTLDDGAPVAPLSFNLFTPAYAAGMSSITFGLGGVPSTSSIPTDDPTPRELKTEVLDKLDELKSQTDKKKSDKTLDKAKKSVTNSLKDNRWIDDTHLDPKKGHKVFDDEKKAVKELRKLIGHNNNDPALDLTLVQMAIDNLCEADRILAQTAIDDVNDPDNKKIIQANKKMDQAQSLVDNNRCDKAIDKYKDAWKKAQDALKE